MIVYVLRHIFILTVFASNVVFSYYNFVIFRLLHSECGYTFAYFFVPHFSCIFYLKGPFFLFPSLAHFQLCMCLSLCLCVSLSRLSFCRCFMDSLSLLKYRGENKFMFSYIFLIHFQHIFVTVIIEPGVSK